jgi:hypothetical protein
LPNDAIEFIIETIQEFWSQNTDFQAWHVTKLNILYKGKGDPQDLNNTEESVSKNPVRKS